MSQIKEGTAACGSVYDAAILATSQKFVQGRAPALGDKISFKDGREFRFVSSIVAFAPGEGVAMATPIATATAIGAVAAIGSKTITLAAGVVAANLYADGFIATVHDTGKGQSYKIKSNTAGTSTVGAILSLYDPLNVALVVATDVNIIKNPFKLCLASTADLPFIGVANVTAAGTDEYYFWVQTRGPCAMKGTCTGGSNVMCTSGGACAVMNAVTDQLIGLGILGSSTDNSNVWLSGMLV